MTRPSDRQDIQHDPSRLQLFLTELFAVQNLAIVATVREQQPFTNLVAFAATNDLKHLVFATRRETRKFANLSKNPSVAMTIDNRRNITKDFSEATAVMAIGTAEEVTGPEKETLLAIYVAKHPGLKTFVSAPSCALIRIDVAKYDIVKQFQSVVELQMPSGP
ncbi:MAG: pyridoxamine 5'-phosphate oxidase family protein [Deltaproteobacteria bacterium]|nr:pyridoxamine 5'-phosphate oxidase family protein [Deltaproteobacteria bacterium]